MRARSLSHLSNGALLSALEEAEARDRAGTVELLGYLAEVDRRRLFVPAGYPSMFVWCVETRHYSEAMASRRIAAARAQWQGDHWHFFNGYIQNFGPTGAVVGKHRVTFMEVTQQSSDTDDSGSDVPST